jgi:hypothetical protein
MSNDIKKPHPDQENLEITEGEGRRKFLKDLGKYSVVTSAATSTLLTSKRSAASMGTLNGGGPPGSPGGL